MTALDNRQVEGYVGLHQSFEPVETEQYFFFEMQLIKTGSRIFFSIRYTFDFMMTIGCIMTKIITTKRMILQLIIVSLVSVVLSLEGNHETTCQIWEKHCSGIL